MNADVKKRWLEALRSGEYEQFHEGLKGRNAYCCLGVLNDLYRRETGNGDWDEEDLGSFIVPTYTNKDFIIDAQSGDCEDCSENEVYVEEQFLHPLVMKWAGLKEPCPFVNLPEPAPNGRVASTLADINDRGVAFESIADLIEEQL